MERLQRILWWRVCSADTRPATDLKRKKGIANAGLLDVGWMGCSLLPFTVCVCDGLLELSRCLSHPTLFLSLYFSDLLLHVVL